MFVVSQKSGFIAELPAGAEPLGITSFVWLNLGPLCWSTDQKSKQEEMQCFLICCLESSNPEMLSGNV